MVGLHIAVGVLPDRAQCRRGPRRRHRLVPQPALDPLLVPAARRPGRGLPPGPARRPPRRHRPRARGRPPLPLRNPSPRRLLHRRGSPRRRRPARGRRPRPRVPHPRRTGVPGPRDRPPRDGDHGRQLRRHLLPRPARGGHERVVGQESRWSETSRGSRTCGRLGMACQVDGAGWLHGSSGGRLPTTGSTSGSGLPLPWTRGGTGGSSKISMKFACGPWVHTER